MSSEEITNIANIVFPCAWSENKDQQAACITARETEQFEGKSNDKSFYQSLSLTSKNLLAAGIVSAAIGLGLYALDENKIEEQSTAPVATQLEATDVQSTNIYDFNVSSISVLDLYNHIDVLLPDGENSIPPINFIINSTEPSDQDLARKHLETRQEILSITNDFETKAAQANMSLDDPMERVLFAIEYDEKRAEDAKRLEGRAEPSYLGPEGVQRFIQAMDKAGQYRRYDRERLLTLPEQFKTPNPS